MPRRMQASLLSALLLVPAAVAAPVFVNSIVIPGNATDLYPGTGANGNRLSLGSDLYYDRATDSYYGLADRGPGGGFLSFNTRVQKFHVDVDKNTGAISNYKTVQTIGLIGQNGQPLNGQNPQLLSNNTASVGNSFDPEGVAVSRCGTLFVSDEYGPSVIEVTRDGKEIRRFETPSNLLPRTNNSINFVSDYNIAPFLVSGRILNRGFEGLSITPDGKTLFAVLQDPLFEDGLPPSVSTNNYPGRYSRNIRVVRFDTRTGKSTGQYVYQLESLADINARILASGSTDTFSANAQGRSIGLSGILALSATTFLVLERDNRGVGVDLTPLTTTNVGSKRIYLVDISNNPTDVSGRTLAGSNFTIAGVTSVQKELFLDIQAALNQADLIIPEKIEGITIGPKLSNDRYLLLVGTDNDFSVTQDSPPAQEDQCFTFVNETTYTRNSIPLNGVCPGNTFRLPTFLYAFTVTAAELRGYMPQERVETLSISRSMVEVHEDDEEVSFDVTLSAAVVYDVKVTCEVAHGDKSNHYDHDSSDYSDELDGGDSEGCDACYGGEAWDGYADEEDDYHHRELNNNKHHKKSHGYHGSNDGDRITIRKGETMGRCTIHIPRRKHSGEEYSFYVRLSKPSRGAVVSKTNGKAEVVVMPEEAKVELKVHAPSSVKKGEKSEIEVKVYNPSDSTIDNIYVKLMVPDEDYVKLDYKKFNPRPNEHDEDTYEWSKLKLRAGQYKTYKVPFEARSKAKGKTLKFLAHVSHDDYDHEEPIHIKVKRT